MTADTVNILGGKLGGHGTIQTAMLTIGAGATLAPGNSPGVLTIDPGNLYVEGVLEIEIAGTAVGQYDVLHVDNGKVTFAPHSTLKFVLYNSYNPADDDKFEFLTANLIEGLNNLTYAISGLPGGFGYQVYSEKTATGGTDLYVRFYAVGQVSQSLTSYSDTQILYDGQVPEPTTTALALLGLTLLAWFRQRRVRVVRRI